MRRDSYDLSRDLAEVPLDGGYDLDEIRNRAIELMDEIGTRLTGKSLQSMGWTFRFDGARRRLGICRWRKAGRTVKVISVSRYYARVEGWEVMEDVVRHEIAHALDYEIRGKSNHDRRWQALARLTGADPTRLYEGPALNDTSSKYVGVCPVCGHEQPFYRRVRRLYACPVCCRKHSDGRFTKRFKLVIVERATGKVIAQDPSPPKKYTATCPGCGGKRHFAKKPRYNYACKSCCDRHADGRYDPRFEWIVTKNY